MEGRTYVCAWKETPNGFAVWVRSRPAVRADAPTFAAADEALYDEILRAYGDGENVREYDPPAPVSDEVAALFPVRLVTVVGNASAPILNIDDLYEGGVCAECSLPRGPRTAARARLDDVESGFDGGFTKTFSFFSEAFVALLTAKERKACDWRPIERPGRSRKVFLEMVARQSVPFVVVRGMDFAVLECSVCGSVSQPYRESSFPIDDFVCVDDLPPSSATCLAVGPMASARLCLTRDRWRRIAGRPGTRGLMSFDVGVVSGDRCDRNPPRRVRELSERVRAMEKARAKRALKAEKAAPPRFLARAKAGDAEAQFEVVVQYDDEEDRLTPHDPALAAQWFDRAAGQGHQEAMVMLASKYVHGDGVARDRDKAVAWLERLVIVNPGWGNRELGNLYLDPNFGPRDLAKAEEYYERAVAHGDELARQLLGKPASKKKRGKPKP